MPRKGDILDEKYRLLESIGKGGMGEIFEAEHVELGKRVAVKFLHREVAKNPTNVARLTREAKAAAAVGHKSIIDVYDIGTSLDDHVFLVMEFLDGESLRDMLKRRGELDVPLAAYIVCQVLSALDAAHEKNIIHRDLKPDNIFLVNARQALPDVKLLDFGISKILDGCAEDRLTKTGDIVGTPYYMAPEQAKGQEHVDRRCDIYSMGAILYECLTGRGPFVAENVIELVYKLLHETIVPVSQLRPGISNDLEDLVMKALSRDPDDRFATAVEMFRHLLPFTGEQGASRVTLPEGIGDSVEDEASKAEEDWSNSASMATVPSGQMSPLSSRHADVASGVVEGEEVVEADEKDDHAGGGVERRRNVVPVFVLIGVIVVAVVGLLLGSGMFQQSSSRDTSDARAAMADDSSSTHSGDERGMSEDRDDGVVTISLEEVPSEALVFLDGARVDRTVLRRPRDSVLVELRVEVPGHGRWRRMVSFDEDATIAVVLESDDAGPTASDADRSHDSKSSGRPNARVEIPSKVKQQPRRDTTDAPEGRPGLNPETQFPGRKNN